jgi:signal transduction histidine kinase
MIKNQNLNNKDIMDLIRDYISDSKYGSDIDTIIKAGLDIFDKVDFIENSSVFLLDDLSFTFQHEASSPENADNDSKEYFEELMQKGIIDNITKTAKPEFYPNEFNSKSNKNALIFPLTVSWGNLGILILNFNKDNGLYSDSLTLDLFDIYCNLFASSIERVNLFENLRLANTELENKVSERTGDLEQSRREFEAILNSVQTGILVLRQSDLSIHKINPVAIEMLGFKEDADVIGQNAGDFLNPIVFNSQNPTNFETIIKRLDNEEISVYCNIASLRFKENIFSIVSFLDITERKNAEKALIQINSDLEDIVRERTGILTETIKKLEVEASERELAEDELKVSLRNAEKVTKMKTEFVNNVSHEFRTPLTIIRSSAQLLEVYDSKLDKDAKKNYLDRIINTVDFLTNLIQNVIHIGREDDTSDPLLIETFKLEIFTGNIFDELLNSLNEKRQLKIVCTPSDLTIKIHKKNLWLIIYNLLSNAIKFSEEDSEIEVNYSLEDNKLTAEIIDHGIGISESDLEKVFDMFFRGENVGAVSGTGLGLAVVRQIVGNLKGQISIKSKLGEGTQVRMSLDLVK